MGSRRQLAILSRQIVEGDREARLRAVYDVSYRSLRRSASRATRAGLLIDRLRDRAEDPRVRGQAAEGLAFAGLTGAGRRRVLSVLGSALDDPEPEVRFWSLYAIAEHRHASVRGSASSRDVRRLLPRMRRLTADTVRIDGWWSVGEEAADALYAIEHGVWPEESRFGDRGAWPLCP